MIKRDAKLFGKLLSKIEKSVWYRQRFDACPHFMFFLGDAHISNIQHSKYPFGQRFTYAGFSRNRADWYHALGELEFTTQGILEASKKDSALSKNMIKEFKPAELQFYKACLDLKKVNLEKLGNKQLVKVYKDLAKVYTDKLNSSPLIDGFALSTDTMIANKIEKFLEAKNLQHKFVEYFARLTAPVFLSFLQLEEIALLKLSMQVKKNPKLKKELLEKHRDQYFWIQNNYVKDHMVSAKDFEARLNKFMKIDAAKKIKETESIPKVHSAEKKKLIKELSLPKEIQNLLNITDDFNYWQDERKKGTFWATHYFSLLLQEVAKRTKYSLEQLKYSFPPEIEQILENKISPKELNQRINYCMLVWIVDNYDVTTDIDFITKLDKIGTGEYAVVSEVKGFTAALGKAKGKVRIIESADEIGKVNKGDILVAVMTRPDYLPAMQKAAAFVTDEGGITCHAAIVAREMKKPCVIGTKIATKTFKDGDVVEVDADKGIVKKI